MSEYINEDGSPKFGVRVQKAVSKAEKQSNSGEETWHQKRAEMRANQAKQSGRRVREVEKEPFWGWFFRFALTSIVVTLLVTFSVAPADSRATQYIDNLFASFFSSESETIDEANKEIVSISGKPFSCVIVTETEKGSVRLNCEPVTTVDED